MRIRHVSSGRLQALCLLRAGPACQIFHSISLWHVLHIPELKITAAREWGAAWGGSRSRGAGWLNSLPSLGRTGPGHANPSLLSSPLPPHTFLPCPQELTAWEQQEWKIPKEVISSLPLGGVQSPLSPQGPQRRSPKSKTPPISPVP